MDWVRRVERVFDYKEYDDRKAYKIAELNLTSYASLWLENLQKRRRKEDRGKINKWSKLKKYMKKRFVPADYEQNIFLRMHALTQESMSLDEYIMKFEELSMGVGLKLKNANTTKPYCICRVYLYN